MSINQTFYQKVKETGVEYHHVAEVGVWHPDTSNVFDFILEGTRATLVEPDPRSVRLIEQRFKDFDNVELHPCALCDFAGDVELFSLESSTFLGSLEASPAIVNDCYAKSEADAFNVRAVKFSQIDDGCIDVLSVDTEGSEWFVLKHMKSRPVVISLETHGGAYVNPHYQDITQWMTQNNYVLWYKGRCDSVYAQRGKVKITLLDRLRNLMMDLKITLVAFRKRLSNRCKTRR